MTLQIPWKSGPKVRLIFLNLCPPLYLALSIFSLLLALHMCVLSCFSHVRFFATPWTVAAGLSVHGVLQARILEWIAMPSSRGSFRPSSCIAGRLYHWATKEASLLALPSFKILSFCITLYSAFLVAVSNSINLYYSVRDKHIFWGSKITEDGDCSHENKRHLLLGRKAIF